MKLNPVSPLLMMGNWTEVFPIIHLYYLLLFLQGSFYEIFLNSSLVVTLNVVVLTDSISENHIPIINTTIPM